MQRPPEHRHPDDDDRGLKPGPREQRKHHTHRTMYVSRRVRWGGAEKSERAVDSAWSVIR